MCLIAFALHASARWPLVIAANRDEFLARPTLPLSQWESANGQTLLSGRDLQAGGTWLGLTPGGRVAFLTNVRQGQAEPAPHSRGELVTRWLDADPATTDAAGFIEELAREGDAGSVYGGFNLVIGDFQRQSWTWISNRPPQPAQPTDGDAPFRLWTRSLEPGIYGLSNASLDTPWPKTEGLKLALAGALAQNAQATSSEPLTKTLFTALASQQQAPQDQLPATGIPLPLEAALSSIFVDAPEHAYGTRSSSVLVVAPDAKANSDAWQVQFGELTHADEAELRRSGRPVGAKAWQMPWPATPVAAETGASQPL